MDPHLIALVAHQHQNGLMGGLVGWVIVSFIALVVFHVLKSVFGRSPAA